MSHSIISSNTITIGDGSDMIITNNCITVDSSNMMHTHSISNHSHQLNDLVYRPSYTNDYWKNGYSPPLPDYQPSIDMSEIRRKLDEIQNKQEDKQEKVPMKTLFNVVVVSTKEEILLDKKVVASDTDEAKFLADVSEVLKEKKLLPKAVTILCTALGQVKVEKEPDKVKLVQE